MAIEIAEPNPLWPQEFAALAPHPTLKGPQMEMTLTFEPTVGEISTAIKGNSRKARMVMFTGVAVTIVAGLALIARDSWAIGVIALLLGGFYLLILSKGFKAVTAKEAARLCNQTTLAVSPERYSFTLPSGSTDTLWELTKVVITPAAWTFSVANRIALILPKRVMSVQQQAEFTAFLNSRPKSLVKIA